MAGFIYFFSFEYQLLLGQLFSDQTFKNQNYIIHGRDTFFPVSSLNQHNEYKPLKEKH